MPSRPAWRPLVAGTVGLFLVILAFLAGQLEAGGDPAVGHRGAAAQQATEGATGAPQGAPDDGFIPGGSAPAPPVTTHQS